MGRFINADAYASTGQGILGNNMFAYCQNNPVIFSDSTGRALTPAVAAGIAGGLYGLLSYLMSTSEPTIKGALLAIGVGAAGAVAGIWAGPVNKIMKLVLSAAAGLGSAISAWYTEAQSGGSTEECMSAALNSFLTCGVITYLGSYIEFPMLKGMAEAAAMFDVTLISGFVATALSFASDPICDKISASLTYAPNYSPTQYIPTKKSGGCGMAGYCVISISA